jgi:two-component system response regulator (stage 0 sporulation protein A)
MKIQVNGDQVILSKTELLQILGGNAPEPVQETADSKPKSLEVIITEYLVKANFRRGIQGFNYLRSAIALCAEDPNLCCSMMGLYKTIGRQYNVTASGVERCIRHAIETAFFGKDKPCNSEFIASAADDISLGLNQRENE